MALNEAFKTNLLTQKFRDFINNNKDPNYLSPPEIKPDERKNQDALAYSEIQDPEYIDNFEHWDNKDPDSIAVAGDS